MIYSLLRSVAIFGSVCLILPASFAAIPKKRPSRPTSTRVTVETYPAVESGEELDSEISLPRKMRPGPEELAQMPVPPTQKERSQKRSRKSVARTPAPLPPPPTSLGNSAPTNVPLAKRQSIPAYEVVPEEKREQILKRMQLCESLFKETGRAYDYRLMTTGELESELRSIRVASASKSAPAETREEMIPEKDAILDTELSPEVE